MKSIVLILGFVLVDSVKAIQPLTYEQIMAPKSLAQQTVCDKYAENKKQFDKCFELPVAINFCRWSNRTLAKEMFVEEVNKCITKQLREKNHVR